MDSIDIVCAIKWHRENLEYTFKEVATHSNLSQLIYSKIKNAKRYISLNDYITLL